MDKDKTRKKLLNPWSFKFWMWTRLPSVGFWGIRVMEIDSEKCVVKLPFSWFTQNPFKSIYFSALAGAAELSTGLLCQYYLSYLGNFSMLVIGFKAEFTKKATSDILFSCHQGSELNHVLKNLTEKGDSNTLVMISEGFNVEGQRVARMEITWSFKRK